MDTVGIYNEHALRLSASYESLPPQAVHRNIKDFIPKGLDLTALDIGAGSGRDAAWLTSLGFQVVAVEPSAGMRTTAQKLHPLEQIQWLDDRLPTLSRVHAYGVAYDLILLIAVWMHVPVPDRERAFLNIATLLKPGGVLMMSLREGPSEPDRPMWPATLDEVETLARLHGLSVLKSAKTADQMGRTDVSWTSVVLRLPDDGSGALPLEN